MASSLSSSSMGLSSMPAATALILPLLLAATSCVPHATASSRSLSWYESPCASKNPCSLHALCSELSPTQAQCTCMPFHIDVHGDGSVCQPAPSKYAAVEVLGSGTNCWHDQPPSHLEWLFSINNEYTSRALPEKVALKDNSVEVCAASAQAWGSQIFAVQFGKECWYWPGSTTFPQLQLAMQYGAADSATCNHACAGDASGSSMCGGYYTFQLYAFVIPELLGQGK